MDWFLSGFNNWIAVWNAFLAFKKLVDNITNQGKILQKPIHFNFDQNHPVEHQMENTECGVYSLFFIIYMLEDAINGNHLKKKIYRDKYIEGYRNVFFNKDL